MNHESDRAQLEALTTALRAEVERERRRGRRRTASPKARVLDSAPAVRPISTATSPRTAAPKSTSVSPAPTASSGTAAVAAGCASLAELREAVAACRACALCETRNQTVFSDGSGTARVMFIGEAPGADEDAQGVPFVGKAGQLLTDIITKGMKLRRDEVYIANVLKCRPPGNRDPERSEKDSCTHFLDRQIELVNPEVLIPLGRHASAHLLNVDLPMGRMRGRVHEVKGRKVVPTYHPAFLLRTPSMKRECWQDIQLALEVLAAAD